MYAGMRVMLATMHGKEQVIAPAVEGLLGVSCEVAQGINTDLLGTFSGEIPRGWDPVETMRRKNLMARQVSGCGLAMSSEGSFGPHPFLSFLPVNEEWMMLSDFDHNLEYVVHEVFIKTNFAGRQVSSFDDLEQFASEVQFPDHAIILRKGGADSAEIMKGITDLHALRSVYDRFADSGFSVWAETDMRAMHNPTRMENIGKLAVQLATRVATPCPKCGGGGFGKSRSRTGLPCGQCGFPTASVWFVVSSCQHCGHEQEGPNDRGVHEEDPMYCQLCNP